MIRYIDARQKSCDDFLQRLAKRNSIDREDVTHSVDRIVRDVKNHGDMAVFKYTLQYDGVEINSENIKVSGGEIERACDMVDNKLMESIRRAASNIREFHLSQKQNSWFDTKENGVFQGQMTRPLETVGVYVPGGTATLASSVLMNIIPAKVAGVEKVIMTTPPGADRSISPVILAAAKEAGADEIFKVGGAQAIAALAFGTEAIPEVDKITGPGNIYVATAKRMVYGFVDIDMVAGPSEILVIADESAEAKFAAADLLSQAEHDVMAASILVTTSESLAKAVIKEIERQAVYLGRKDIISKSLADYGAVILVSGIDNALRLVNLIAPEHLELCVKEPFGLLDDIRNAGAVFLGNFSSEPLGDYFAGPNHVLPTGGTARFFSPLGTADFMKRTSVISYGREALKNAKDDVVCLAEAEGLQAHANAIRVRFE